MGQSLIGQNIHVDITSLPHLLVAGSTGSGKSVFLNGLIYQLSRFNHPDKLQFVLCDPKKVELSIWGDLPHVIQEPFTNLGDMLKASAWLTKEMDARYEAMRKAKVKEKLPDMPYIVAVVDELADIRLSYYGSGFEYNLNRIAALGRAAGIHLVLATQRPSADVITGALKSNIIARLAFSVASKTDSRIILDSNGAEALTGKGDFLFKSPQYTSPIRGLNAFLRDDDIAQVLSWISWHGAKRPVENILDEKKKKKVVGPPKLHFVGDLYYPGYELPSKVKFTFGWESGRNIPISYNPIAGRFDIGKLGMNIPNDVMEAINTLDIKEAIMKFCDERYGIKKSQPGLKMNRSLTRSEQSKIKQILRKIGNLFK